MTARQMFEAFRDELASRVSNSKATASVEDVINALDATIEAAYEDDDEE